MKRSGWIGGTSRARSIPGDDVELVPELHELPPPDARVTEEPVQEHERRAAAGAAVGDLAPANIDLAEDSRHRDRL
jgi:hypothetical protein